MSYAPVVPENFSLLQFKRKLCLQKNLSGIQAASWNISHLIFIDTCIWAPDKFLWALIFLIKNSEQKFSGVTVFFESPKPLIFLSAYAITCSPLTSPHNGKYKLIIHFQNYTKDG